MNHEKVKKSAVLRGGRFFVRIPVGKAYGDYSKFDLETFDFTQYGQTSRRPVKKTFLPKSVLLCVYE